VNYVQVLDVMEQLLTAAKHPDIIRVERYGTSNAPWGPSAQESKVKSITGVKVKHRSTATASLWLAVWPGEKPITPPAAPLPPRQHRGPRLAILAAQLLDVAQPAQFKARNPRYGAGGAEHRPHRRWDCVVALHGDRRDRRRGPGSRSVPRLHDSRGGQGMPVEDEPMPASRCSECGAVVTAKVGDRCPPHQTADRALCRGSGQPTAPHPEGNN
jgi:hypothetical protein